MTRLRPALIAFATLATFGAAGLQAAAAPAAADRSAAVSRALLQIQRFPAQSLHGVDQSYEARDVIVDADGTEHVRFDRRYRGLRVIGGDLVVHSSANGVLREMSKTLDRPIALPAKASIDALGAQAIGLAGRAGYVPAGLPEQVVYAVSGTGELAYDVRANGTQADGSPSELHVIVSGLNGQVLDSWDGIEPATTVGTGNGKGFFNGTVSLTTDSVTGGFALSDPSRGNQFTYDLKNTTSSTLETATNMVDADNLWGDGTLANVQSVAVDAQYGTSVTWTTS